MATSQTIWRSRRECRNVHGNVFFQRGPLLFVKLMIHLRVDDAAGNGVHRDVAGSKLFGKRPGQAVDSGFGGRVATSQEAPEVPHIEEMLMMAPCFLATMLGTAARQQ